MAKAFHGSGVRRARPQPRTAHDPSRADRSASAAPTVPPLSRPAVSEHLAVLKRAGLVREQPPVPPAPAEPAPRDPRPDRPRRPSGRGGGEGGRWN
ncbi:winged helix-turn-helix domain-containing protein [Streptomyces sp. NPDC056891]|uniref:helix-turn-helix domain-containing protein n=1 Tax=Streptomyces sp. NPDC056891 TaxID=3345961 RepID=UPI0036BCFBBB